MVCTASHCRMASPELIPPQKSEAEFIGSDMDREVMCINSNREEVECTIRGRSRSESPQTPIVVVADQREISG